MLKNISEVHDISIHVPHVFSDIVGQVGEVRVLAGAVEEAWVHSSLILGLQVLVLIVMLSQYFFECLFGSNTSCMAFLSKFGVLSEVVFNAHISILWIILLQVILQLLDLHLFAVIFLFEGLELNFGGIDCGVAFITFLVDFEGVEGGGLLWLRLGVQAAG